MDVALKLAIGLWLLSVGAELVAAASSALGLPPWLVALGERWAIG
jgi:hypothetical protein